MWGWPCAGSALRSDELRARYNVGISPLREALTRLDSERLVTSVGQRGFRVAPLTAYDVEDTMTTRIVIEREALARSIEKAISRWETAVVAAFHGLSRNPIPKEPGTATNAGPLTIGNFIWRCYRRAGRAGTWSLPGCCSIKPNGIAYCAENSRRQNKLKARHRARAPPDFRRGAFARRQRSGPRSGEALRNDGQAGRWR